MKKRQALYLKNQNSLFKFSSIYTEKKLENLIEIYVSLSHGNIMKFSWFNVKLDIDINNKKSSKL